MLFQLGHDAFHQRILKMAFKFDVEKVGPLLGLGGTCIDTGQADPGIPERLQQFEQCTGLVAAGDNNRGLVSAGGRNLIAAEVLIAA